MNRFAFVTFAFLSLIRTANSVAQEKDFWILTNPEPPFVVQDDKRQLSGYIVDLVQGILQQAEVEQDILAAPWERVEREARTKANVLVFALARTPERESHYHWLTPITANIFAVYTKQTNTLSIDSIADLNQFKRISVLRGDVRHKIMQQYKIQGAHPFDDWTDALAALLRDDTEALFFSDAGMAYFCSELGHHCSGLKRIFTYQKTESYLVLSKPGTDLELVNKFAAAAKQFKASDDYQQMSKVWVEKYRKEITIPMHLEDGVLNLWKK